MSSTEPLVPPRYASRVALTGIANGAISAVCAAVALPLLVSALGMEQYGRWAVLGLFITTGAALDLGLSRAIVLKCAGQPRSRVSEYTSAALLIAGGLALAAITLVAIVVTSLASAGLPALLPATVDASILTGGCAILFIGMLNAVLRATLESQLAAHWVNVGYLAQTVFLYGFSLLAALYWRNGIVLAAVSALALVLVLHALLLARDGVLGFTWPRPETLRETWRTGLHSYLLAAPIALLPPAAAALVLGQVADPATFGVFDLAFRIATLSSTLLASIAVPVLALSARAHGTGVGAAQLAGWVRRYLAAGWALFALGLLTFGVLGSTLLGWVFPAAGPTLFPLTALMLTGLCAVTASEPATRALLGGPRPNAVLLARLLMFAVVMIPGAWLLRDFGVLGFGMAWMVGGLITTATLLAAWLRPATRG